MKKVTFVACVAVGLLAVQPAHAFTPPPATEVSVRHASGAHQGWNGQVGPALSLSKLYLGYWVLHHGSEADKALVEPMIRTSDDGLASQLGSRYPNAIADVTRDFGLHETVPAAHWGDTRTSMADVTYFLYQIESDPVAEPLRQGMRNAAPIAADGFPQNYGTGTLPGVQGTKYGWSDDRRSWTASASFGPGFYVAARTAGPAEQLTHDIQGVPLPVAPAPAIPGSS